jgi:hypothetical protein
MRLINLVRFLKIYVSGRVGSLIRLAVNTTGFKLLSRHCICAIYAASQNVCAGIYGRLFPSIRRNIDRGKEKNKM